MSPGDLAKAASDRFSIVSAFPAALVVLMVFALIQTGGFPHRPHLSRLLPEHEQLGSGTVLFLALAVFILALTLQPFQLALVRLLEGYWGSWLISRQHPRRVGIRVVGDVSAHHAAQPGLAAFSHGGLPSRGSVG